MATDAKPLRQEQAETDSVRPRVRQRVMVAVREIERDARISARCHFRAANFWSTVFYLLGLPTTVLAAVAGVSALSEHTTAAAILAITVAALSAATTFLNAGERAHAHDKKRAEYEGLKNRARHFRTVDGPLIYNEEKLVGAFKQLDASRDLLQRESPQVRMGSWNRAEKEVTAKHPRAQVGERPAPREPSGSLDGSAAAGNASESVPGLVPGVSRR